MRIIIKISSKTLELKDLFFIFATKLKSITDKVDAKDNLKLKMPCKYM